MPKIKASFFAVLIVISLFFTHSYLSLAAMLSATLQEIGHIIAAKLCNIPLNRLKLDIFGASLEIGQGLYPYKSEVILAAAGPTVNIITFLLLIPFLSSPLPFFELVALSSLFLAILNLLPILDFDGGRILSCLLASVFDTTISTKVCSLLSYITVFLLWIISVYLMLRLGTSLSLFVFSSALFVKLFTLHNY